jgi:DNA-binding transcriptional LysR family regulator
MHGPEQLIRIAAGKLDVGILRLPIQHQLPNLDTKVLLKERMVVALREDHPVARLNQVPVSDLRDESFIVWRGEQPITLEGHLLALAQKGGFPLRVAQSAPSLPTMIALVAGGTGIAYVPESLRNMNIPRVCFRPLMDLERFSEVVVCYRSDETSLAVWKLLKIIDVFAPKGS